MWHRFENGGHCLSDHIFLITRQMKFGGHCPPNLRVCLVKCPAGSQCAIIQPLNASFFNKMANSFNAHQEFFCQQY